ncbi:RNA-binding riboflavin kinase RibR [Paenibacillus konkukensis]|uniref:RNA-binding riboflavin kinase RibR n=1 Tax=Paenibacillus konkukensis TaxID=2020716 RepID=A0ABY4RGD5_9BACL|nr:RNA-binding protein [Paenibacillus konkukensis]UQZ81531.1 RNA-binding riboflavin kinase RibR [Paenibacillus konkukensis]
MIANAEPWAELDESEVLHLPDIQFVTYCFQTFGLNRGIYNTIDQWLYGFGYRDVLQRRKSTLSFLRLINARGGRERSGGILRFGKGGVTKQLYDFIHLPEPIFLSQEAEI